MAKSLAGATRRIPVEQVLLNYVAIGMLANGAFALEVGEFASRGARGERAGLVLLAVRLRDDRVVLRRRGLY